jgi:hypothetical protein
MAWIWHYENVWNSSPQNAAAERHQDMKSLGGLVLGAGWVAPGKPLFMFA